MNFLYVDLFTYECQAESGQSTVWKGTAFMCSHSNDEIILHIRSKFENGTCNNGDIVGEITEIDGMTYTSQVYVTFGSSLIGKTVECFVDDGEIESFLIRYTITGTDHARYRYYSYIDESL